MKPKKIKEPITVGDIIIKEYDLQKIYAKNIHLSGAVMNSLELMAAKEHRKLKPFIEKILLEYSVKNKL